MSRALVREMPASFDRAIVGHGSADIDVDLARRQHLEYQRCLADAGYDLVVVPADENQPDCVFVEDMAVVLGDAVLATRSGAPERRGEAGPVVDVLSRWFTVTTMREPATLDGGDVMVIGKRVFVGLSKRTNRDGVDQLGHLATALGYTVVPVPVTGVLHLKSAMLPVRVDTVVVTPGTIDESLLNGLRIVHELEDERHRFSALPLGDEAVLVTASAPRTSELVASLGLTVTPIDVSEIQAADGGLTCLSILF